MTALVTGATGHVGRHVVSGLLSAGVEVRAVSRAPEKAGLPAAAEIVQGDMTQPDSLRAALQDVDRMYLFPVPETATAVVQLAKAAGVRRIVTLSSVAASYPAGDMSGDHHRVVEQAVEASGLSWTHLRPGEFMSNSLNWVPSIRDERVVREPYGTATSAMVHEADIADVAVAALLEDGHAGAKYRLTGRERLTKTERVAIIGDVLGWDITFEELTPEQARALWKRWGVPAAAIDWLIQPPKGDAVVGPTMEQVTGQPARTFAEWVADHRADFQPG
jgi:uncharacterized protein YbjT (DUF2867 family)